jgi:ATP-dependent RNA helicase DeaD
MRRHTLKTAQLRTIVLDEADEMLNMGFREDIETILSETPADRQTILFSATMPQSILDITNEYQHDAQIIRVVKKELTVKNIEQYYFEVRQNHKSQLLIRLLDMHKPHLTVIFCNTKRKVDELTSELQNSGYQAEGLHGDLKQQQRDRVMDAFRNGKAEILVATDVAARGIDVNGVDLVVNYDLPQENEYYVHRIGRTGRAGKKGLAFTFVSGRELYRIRDLQRACKTKITVRPIPSLKDVNQTRMDGLFDELRSVLEHEDLDAHREVLENRMNEQGYSAMDLAAALLKLHPISKELDCEDTMQSSGKKGGFQRDLEVETVRLFINIGKKQGVRPRDIVGAIAGESGLSGNLIGPVSTYDKFTFVDVPKGRDKDVLRAMKNAKIRGKSIRMERATRR